MNADRLNERVQIRGHLTPTDVVTLYSYKKSYPIMIPEEFGAEERPSLQFHPPVIRAARIYPTRAEAAFSSAPLEENVLKLVWGQPSETGA